MKTNKLLVFIISLAVVFAVTLAGGIVYFKYKVSNTHSEIGDYIADFYKEEGYSYIVFYEDGIDELEGEYYYHKDLGQALFNGESYVEYDFNTERYAKGSNNWYKFTETNDAVPGSAEYLLGFKQDEIEIDLDNWNVDTNCKELKLNKGCESYEYTRDDFTYTFYFDAKTNEIRVLEVKDKLEDTTTYRFAHKDNNFDINAAFTQQQSEIKKGLKNQGASSVSTIDLDIAGQHIIKKNIDTSDYYSEYKKDWADSDQAMRLGIALFCLGPIVLINLILALSTLYILKKDKVKYPYGWVIMVFVTSFIGFFAVLLIKGRLTRQ